MSDKQQSSGNLAPGNEIDITPEPAVLEGDYAETLPTSDKGYRRLGMLILLVAFGGFGIWSFTATLAVAVVAPGNVSMESFKRSVQHLEGGIVREILVEDGDKVEAGQPLIILSDTQFRSQLDIARAQYLINRAMEIRLLAEQAGSESLIFPEELLESSSSRVQQVLAVQQSLFMARRESLQGALESLDEQSQQMSEQITGLESQVAINTRRVSSLRREAEDFRSLFREGLGDNQRLRELERQVLEYQGRIAEYRSQMASLKSQISENRLQKEVRRQDFQSEVGELLRDAQSQIAQAEEQIISLTDQVERTVVVAPVSGTVVDRRVHGPGAVVRSGDTIMDVVPGSDGFVVEVRVPVRDIDNIYRGQSAEIRFSAFNQRLTSVIDGEVIYVSADSFDDEATGQHYYRARVRVSEKGKQDMTEQMQLLSGMPAEVMIRTGERTFASYIAKPVTDMLSRAIRED